jgi:TRL-like protein family
MRKVSVAAVGLMVAALGMVGCGAVGPLPGAIYTNTQFPSIASQAGPGHKTGTAQARAYLAMVAVGDASVDTACKNGGITKINTVDTHATSILGVYSTWTTIVTGE